eukprot:306027-Prorocentrum_minimum.AAC.1
MKFSHTTVIPMAAREYVVERETAAFRTLYTQVGTDPMDEVLPESKGRRAWTTAAVCWGGAKTRRAVVVRPRSVVETSVCASLQADPAVGGRKCRCDRQAASANPPPHSQHLVCWFQWSLPRCDVVMCVCDLPLTSLTSCMPRVRENSCDRAIIRPCETASGFPPNPISRWEDWRPRQPAARQLLQYRWRYIAYFEQHVRCRRSIAGAMSNELLQPIDARTTGIFPRWWRLGWSPARPCRIPTTTPRFGKAT